MLTSILKPAFGALCLLASTLLLPIAVACETCLVHRVAPAETLSVATPVATPTLWPAILICVLSTALIVAIVAAVYAVQKAKD